MSAIHLTIHNLCTPTVIWCAIVAIFSLLDSFGSVDAALSIKTNQTGFDKFKTFYIQTQKSLIQSTKWSLHTKYHIFIALGWLECLCQSCWLFAVNWECNAQCKKLYGAITFWWSYFVVGGGWLGIERFEWPGSMDVWMMQFELYENGSLLDYYSIWSNNRFINLKLYRTGSFVALRPTVQCFSLQLGFGLIRVFSGVANTWTFILVSQYWL